MGWSDSFKTSDPETGKETTASVKADSNGYVSDFIYGLENDKDGGKHGHVWGLNSDDDDKIGGRDSRSGDSNDGGSGK